MIINKKRLFGIILTFAAVIILISGLVLLCYADKDDNLKNPIFSSDFDNTSDFGGWAAFGEPVKLELDSAQSHSGNYSLKASERTYTYSGPALNITDIVQPGNNYLFSAWLAFKNDENRDSLRVSVKYTFPGSKEDAGSITDYDTIAEIAPEDINIYSWIHVVESFTVPEGTVEAILYIESENKSSSLWIDDAQIAPDTSDTVNNTPEANAYGLSEITFENADYSGLIPYGGALVKRSKTLPADGLYSLKVSERTDSSDGVAINISPLLKDKDYRFSTYVAFTGGRTEESFSVYLEYKIKGATYNLPVVINHVAERNTWSVIDSIFSIPSKAEEPYLVIQTVSTDDDKDCSYVDFFIDNLKITDQLETDKEIQAEQKKNWLMIVKVSATGLLICAVLVSMRIHFSNKSRIEEASRDSMTGAYNRNTYEKLIAELEKKPEKCRKLFFAVCDVNGLKLLNDNYGHQAGDSCIIKCAELLIENMKKFNGKVYRIGGDEFVCVASIPFSKELSKAVNEEEKSFKQYPFSAALGFASYNSFEDGDIPDVKSIITRCDKEMYLNKKSKKARKNI